MWARATRQGVQQRAPPPTATTTTTAASCSAVERAACAGVDRAMLERHRRHQSWMLGLRLSEGLEAAFGPADQANPHRHRAHISLSRSLSCLACRSRARVCTTHKRAGRGGCWPRAAALRRASYLAQAPCGGGQRRRVGVGDEGRRRGQRAEQKRRTAGAANWLVNRTWAWQRVLNRTLPPQHSRRRGSLVHSLLHSCCSLLLLAARL